MTTSTVFVCTLSGGKPKWSRYEFPFATDAFTQLGEDLYIRSGDVVRRMDPDAITDEVGGEPQAIPGTVRWAYLDAGAPARDKHLEGFDVIGTGACSVQFGYDQRDPDVLTDAFAVDADTAPGGFIPYEIVAPSLSVQLTWAAGGWSLDRVGLYFLPTGGR